MSQLETEHHQLMRTSQTLLGDLATLPDRYAPKTTAHGEHYQFLHRAQTLGLYLQSALTLCTVEQYLPALAVLRAALEHHLTDRLLFLAKRYRRRISGVSKADFARWDSAWKAKEPGTEDIVAMTWQSGTMTVIRSGVHPVDGPKGLSGRTLSVYYFLLERFDPFAGPPNEQRYLARGFTSLEHLVQHAKRQQEQYGEHLRWPAIKDNLLYNRLCSAETIRRFNVHYRFLSAYAHPVPAAHDEVYGRNRPTGAPRYDHYASEIVLLYINKIASEELKAIQKAAGRAPRFTLKGWSATKVHTKESEECASHFWFPEDLPHPYDYVQEANSRGLRGRRLVAREKRPKPNELKVSQIRYYRNPLRRLVAMHTSFSEITGFDYVSPWPRSDAWPR